MKQNLLPIYHWITLLLTSQFSFEKILTPKTGTTPVYKFQNRQILSNICFLISSLTYTFTAIAGSLRLKLENFLKG